MSTIKVCLLTITKNHGSTITTYLDSVADCIDYAVLIDAGSNDNTVSLFETWTKRNNKGCHVTIPHSFNKMPFYMSRYVNLAIETARVKFPDVTHFLYLDPHLKLTNSHVIKTASTTDVDFLQLHESTDAIYTDGSSRHIVMLSIFGLFRSNIKWVSQGDMLNHITTDGPFTKEPIDQKCMITRL